MSQISTLTPNTILANTTTDITVRGLNTHFQKGITVATVNGVKEPFNVSNTVTGTLTFPGMKKGTYTLVISTRSETVSSTITVFAAPVNALTANIEVLAMEAISLKDIDLSNPKATPVLFLTNIYNNDTPRYVNISITVSSGSKNVLLGTITKNNQHLGADTIADFTNQNYDAVKTNGSVAGTPGYDFLNTVELTGAFPADEYIYVLTVTDVHTRQSVSSTTTTIVTNPVNNPSLITPGAEFADNLQVEYNPLPLFQWFGMNDKYDFALYELRAGQTPEEAVRNVPVYKQLAVNGTSLLYPNSAEKLIDGMTYAWQVQGRVGTATSTHYLPSDVFRFTYTNALTAGVKLVSAIKMIPDEIVVPSGGRQQFTAVCYDENNNIVPDAKVTWSITPDYGTISPTGLFTAGAAGKTVAVLVSSGNVTEFATVTISLNVNSDYLNPYDGFIKKLFGLE